MDLSKVKKVAIYPSIGMARVGNSPDEYFFGSMIPGQPAQDSNNFRDGSGAIKRQAAKFFVYGLDKDGNILGELNESHGVNVNWRVDVANKKAAWYDFDMALDIPAAMGKYNNNGQPTPEGNPISSKLRNARTYSDEERKLLMIEARALNISGINKNPDGGQYKFEGTIGREGKKVYLGELKTDEQGRLIFLGGHGKSNSFTNPAVPLTTFANNEGWHDDTSDGPVDATVTLPDGTTMKAEGAWVLTAPPNFAVGVQAFSTGYELLLDVASKMHPNLIVKKPSFYQDIYPTLSQLTINQWVNAGVSFSFGWGSFYEFDNAELIKRLNDDSEENRAFRQSIFKLFRNPDYKVTEPQGWPPLYGDAITLNPQTQDPREWFAITELKYSYLEQWAQGDFIVDAPVAPLSWDDMTPAQQANGLTEAALEEALGGPFHPGCEFTWPMRHATMYKDCTPFRIKRRAKAKDNYGDFLTPAIAFAPGGPLDGSAPGDLTRWMAVPWQSDTSSCLSAYNLLSGEYLPTFWPARVPNDVLTQENYDIINSDDSSSRAKKRALRPDQRKKWLRGYIDPVASSPIGGMTKFTEEWDKIGIVLKQKVNNSSGKLPKEVWVENGRSLKESEIVDTENNLLTSNVKLTKSRNDAHERPDWMSKNPRDLR